MNNEKENLWLPDGYGPGTIIYDNSGHPWQATKSLGSGAGIFEVVKVTPEYANARISGGTPVLYSEVVNK